MGISPAHIRRSRAIAAERRLWEIFKRWHGVEVKRRKDDGPDDRAEGDDLVADFAFPSSRLVVEIDGLKHVDEEITNADACARGLTLVRVRSDDVLHDLPSVLNRIRGHLDVQ